MIMKETITGYSAVIGNLEGKNLLARPKHRWRLIKTAVLETGCYWFI
jgi:hypothetical protein